MLKNIPPIISPELLKVLAEMGHGDKIVLADANFPSNSVGKNSIVIRADGIKIPELLDAILMLYPIDTYVEKPISLMEPVPEDKFKVNIWEKYEDIISKYDCRGSSMIKKVERFDFYNEAKEAYTIIATGETELYANIIIQKGNIKI